MSRRKRKGLSGTGRRVFLGEFVRYRCHCGAVFEIQEPLANPEFPGVRVYAGFCHRCGDGVLHAVSESANMDQMNAALSSFEAASMKAVGEALH